MPVDTTRRRIIQAAAMAATVAPLSRWSRAGDSGPRSLGIAVVGLGDFADFVMPRIMESKRARITALVSGDKAKAEAYAQRFNVNRKHLYDYDNFSRISEDDTVDLVYITLPVGLHAEYAIRAIQAGKHVLTEKTLAATVAQGKAMILAAREHNRHLLIAYRTCFGPAYSTVVRLINSGEYGRVVHLDLHKGFPIALPAGNWRFDRSLSGGGSLVDIGVYSIQAARMFGHGMPSEVTAQAWSPPDPRFSQVEDTVAFTLRFRNGVVASGSSSWSYRLQNRLRVGLERAWIDLEPASPIMNQVLRIARADDGHAGTVVPLAQQDQIPLMFDHVADVVLDGVEPLIPASDGLLDLRVIDAIHHAIDIGGKVRVG